MGFATRLDWRSSILGDQTLMDQQGCYLTPEYPSDQLAQRDRDKRAHPVATP
jgi:hypothetical protein